MARLLRKRPPPPDAPPQQDPAAEPLKVKTFNPANEARRNLLEMFHPDYVPAANVPKESQFRCRYHIGNCINKVWLCCNQPVAAKTEPCGGSHEHVPRPQELEDLYDLYLCYPAPNSPPRSSDIRAAVAIDCEMGTAVSGDPELIRVTLVDYFTEEILVDNIVEPDVAMQHPNTKYSGVSWADVNKARRNGTILDGKGGARQAIWQFVGPDTFVIGHGASNDLRSLRWMHMRVVDSMVTEFVRTKAKEAREAEELKSSWRRKQRN
jgi:RNA exonuclease 1